MLFVIWLAFKFIEHGNTPTVASNLTLVYLVVPFLSGSEMALETMLNHDLDVHTKDNTDGTALHAAAYSGYVNCVELLVEFGACVNAVDKLQHTPLFRACEMGHTEVVHNLILSE